MSPRISHFTTLFRERNLIAIAEHVAPEMYKARRRPLLVRHIGAASMEEVYSMAAMLDANGVDFQSVGHDKNRWLLRKGHQGYRMPHWPPLAFAFQEAKVAKYVDPYFTRLPGRSWVDALQWFPLPA